MATASRFRRFGYLGFFGFLGLLGLFGRAELMSLFALFGLFALFLVPTAKSDGRQRPSRWAIASATCVAMIVLAIVLAQYVIAPRVAQTTVVVPEWDVSIFAPHIDELVAASEAIADLQIDRRTNSVIVTAEARNLDAAVDEVWNYAKDPSLILAASSLDVTVSEARNLQAVSRN